MKFDPQSDIPQNMELIGMSSIPDPELGKLRELFGIRKDALDRYQDLIERAEELQRQFEMANKVLDGHLIELGWKLGWQGHNGVVFDETAGRVFGLKYKKGLISANPDDA